MFAYYQGSVQLKTEASNPPLYTQPFHTISEKQQKSFNLEISERSEFRFLWSVILRVKIQTFFKA